MKESLPPDSFEAKMLALTSKVARNTRGIYEQIYPDNEDYKPPHSKVLFIVGHDIPPAMEEEYNAWYNTEHIPHMLRVPGVLTARRFKFYKEKSSSPTDERTTNPKYIPNPQYITIYDLESEKVLQSAEFKKEGGTPWTLWMRRWRISRLRAAYLRIYPEP